LPTQARGPELSIDNGRRFYTNAQASVKKRLASSGSQLEAENYRCWKAKVSCYILARSEPKPVKKKLELNKKIVV
jgi:hypothetical protein